MAMMTSSHSSRLFPTEIENPIHGFDCDVKITARFIQPTSQSAPPVISPRINNPNLLNSLKRNTRKQIKSPRAQRPRPPQCLTTRNARSNPRFSRPPTCSSVRCGNNIDNLTHNCLEDHANLPNDIEQLRIILAQLRPQRDYLTAQCEYEEAMRYDETMMAAQAKLGELEKKNNDMDTVKNMVVQHQQLQLVISKIIQEWDEKYEAFERTAMEKVDEMNRTNLEELEEFDENSPEEVNMKFMYRSPYSLALRTKEGKLGMIRQYKAALKVKRQVDKIEMEELEKAYIKTQEDFLKRRRKLIAKQDGKVEDFLFHVENVRKVMFIKRNKQIYGYLRRMGMLDKDIDLTCKALHITEDEVADEEIDEEKAEAIAQMETVRAVNPYPLGESFVKAQQKSVDKMRKTHRYVDDDEMHFDPDDGKIPDEIANMEEEETLPESCSNIMYAAKDVWEKEDEVGEQ